ncbi:cysteine hydrolase family protein [Desulforhopalus sp. 52FAK]
MKSAVVVIDVQVALFESDNPPDQAIKTIERINELTSKARLRDAPVIFIQHETIEGPLVYGENGWKLHRTLHVEKSDLTLRKTTPDSFLRTQLETVLRSLRVEHLVVCGYASEFCVDTTVRRAAGLGFPVTLVADAHTTHDKKHQLARVIREHENATLPNITSFGVPITVKASADIKFSYNGC